MYPKSTYYFSKVLGAKILGSEGAAIGRVLDLVVDVGAARPRIAAVLAKLGAGGGRRLLDFGPCRIQRLDRRVVVVAKAERDAVLPEENHLFLKKHLLDKQIVDVDGRKLVRVNDLVLDSIPAGSFLVAVDVGLEGLFRRLGADAVLSAVLKLFGRTLPGKLVLWSEVEAVDLPTTQIKLSKAYSKLDGIHPSDLADILEELDHGSQMALFSSLDEERAADVLEELETGAQVQLLESLPEGKAADVLEKMPADEVADILDELKREKAERLLAEMERESSTEVRSLMAYPEGTVGSLMSTDYIFFNQSMTVSDALAELRKLKPEADTIYYVYVLDARGRYVATVSLRDIVVSELDSRLGEIMNAGVAPLNDRDDVYSIADLLLKYKLHAVPVVSGGERMVGTVVIEDVLERAMRARKRK
jgi:magnesium transporter